MLKELGISAVALHSELSQEQRMRSLEQFRSLLVKILVATDVASRYMPPSGHLRRAGICAYEGRSAVQMRCG